MLKQKAKNFYHKHMDNPLLKGMIAGYRRHSRRGKKVRVVFICQMPQLWNKLESVYQQMRQDSQFECVILAVPDESIAKEHQKESLAFFDRLAGRVIQAQKADGSWVSLEEMCPDYVFYQRPYDHYLPECYQSGTVAAYARICYVPYAYACTVPVEASCYNQAFFTNVYLFFAEDAYARDLVFHREEALYRAGRKKAFYLGYPALDQILGARSRQGMFWEKGQDAESFKMLWCPRWTTDKNLGSSNFFEYKDALPELVQSKDDWSMVFRPHPMMFDNFVKTGEMTALEAENYLRKYQAQDGLYYDKEADYYTTLWRSDILVADLTTVMIEYLVTRKPIIYCVADIEYNAFMKGILSGCYCVGTWEELKETIRMLYAGEDPLKEQRNKAADLLIKGKEHAAEAIVKELKKDFYYE